MTTILADFRLGLMVSDSSVSDGDRVWSEKKVYRARGSLLGFTGDVDEALQFLAWYRTGKKPPKFTHSFALVLSSSGLNYYGSSLIPLPVKVGFEAIGSGAKAAMCAYEAMQFTDPVHAVRIVCRHDNGSRAPVRSYRLNP